MELSSARLILRRLREEDAEPIVSLLRDDRDAILQAAHLPDPCTLESIRGWIAQQTQPGGTMVAVTGAADGAFLGTIGFCGLPEMPSIGYWIGRAYRGEGYATEALRLVIGHVRALGAKGLLAETFPDNPASARVLEKCGFALRGTVRRNYPARGGLVPVRVHILHFATRDAPRAAYPPPNGGA